MATSGNPRNVTVEVPEEYWELLDETVAEDDTTIRRWARRVLVRELERRAALRKAGKARPVLPVSHRRRAASNA